jgi:outer membrane immunogenic protein
MLFSRGCCTNATFLGAVLDKLKALEGGVMRSLLGSVAAIAVTIYSASAADLGVAPAPAPVVPSWTGLYIGVHAGAAWQNFSSGSINDPNGANASGPEAGGSALGAVGGLQAGYNWQFAPAWVAGVEGDFSWTSLADQRGGAALGPNGQLAGGNASVLLFANTQWLASARAKLGFTGWFNNTMLYVTGGAAWANTEYTAVFFANLPPPDQANPTSTTTKSGWVVGGGAEWMATPNILLRAEYLYYGIDSGANLSAVAFPIPAPLPVAVNWSRENIQVFRVAGSYKF